MDTALVQPKSVCDEALGILSRLGAPQNAFAREGVMALSPITGELRCRSLPLQRFGEFARALLLACLYRWQPRHADRR
jgi:hypothetical protein